MSLISVRELSKSYGNAGNKIEVLKDISFDIEENSFVSILGRSGSGKTTLLNILSTLVKFDSGKVFIDGTNIKQLNKKELNYVRNKNIGFVFQEFNLIEDISVLDNVATPLILNGVSFNDAREKAIDVLTKVELDQFVKLRPSELSEGNSKELRSLEQ